jgi:hypothetical protein
MIRLVQDRLGFAVDGFRRAEHSCLDLAFREGRLDVG